LNVDAESEHQITSVLRAAAGRVGRAGGPGVGGGVETDREHEDALQQNDRLKLGGGAVARRHGRDDVDVVTRGDERATLRVFAERAHGDGAVAGLNQRREIATLVGSDGEIGPHQRLVGLQGGTYAQSDDLRLFLTFYRSVFHISDWHLALREHILGDDRVALNGLHGHEQTDTVATGHVLLEATQVQEQQKRADDGGHDRDEERALVHGVPDYT
jgi:hypothetical protein